MPRLLGAGIFQRERVRPETAAALAQRRAQLARAQAGEATDGFGPKLTSIAHRHSSFPWMGSIRGAHYPRRWEDVKRMRMNRHTGSLPISGNCRLSLAAILL